MEQALEQETYQPKGKFKATAKKYGLVALFVSPYLLLFIFFVAIPIVYGIVMAFMNYDRTGATISTWAWFDNFISVFNFDDYWSQQFWNAFKITIIFDLIAVPCLIIIPLLLANLINKKPPMYKLFRAILYLPAVVSISIVGEIFMFLFQGDNLGFFNALFHQGSPFIYMENFTVRWTIILFVSIWWQTGTNFVILSAALRNVPNSLYEACESDGGSKWVCFRYVTIPNIMGSLFLCVFTTLIGYLGLYGQPTVFFDTSFGSTLGEIESPMIFLQKYIAEEPSFSGLWAAYALVFGIIVMIFSFIQTQCMKARNGGNVHEKQFDAYTSF